MPTRYLHVLSVVGLSLVGLAAACADATSPDRHVQSKGPAAAIAPVACGPGSKVKLSANPSNGQVKSGTYIFFTARLTDAAGCENTSALYKWSMSDPAVASLYNPSTTGIANEARGKRAGQSVLTVKAWELGKDTVKISFNVTVYPGDPDHIVMTPGSLSLQPGGVANVTAVMYDYGGNKLNSDFDWSVNNSRLSISGTGTIGTVQVTASTSLPGTPNPATLTAKRKEWGLPAASIPVTVVVPTCYCPPGVVCTCIPA